MVRIQNIEAQLARLNEIGIALSSEQNLNTLLSRILQEARNFTRAEAGSLYLVEADGLRLVVAQNDLLSQRDANRPHSNLSMLLNCRIELSRNSMAGYVGLTGEVVNLEDVYHIPTDRPYRFNAEFDRQNDYRSRSMLLVPMRDLKGRIIGVLQLINAWDSRGRVVSFDRSLEHLVLSLASQAAVAVRNVRLAEELKEAYFDTIFRLCVAVEYKDEGTADHIRRVAHYAAIVAQEQGFDRERLEMLFYAAPMHDVGKIGIDDAILHKRGKLTSGQFEEMKRHTAIGARILGGSQAPLLQMSANIALTHHERFDGGGYPQGLRHDEIPIEGQIIALADVFDALSTKRPYKPAFPIERCLEIIQQGRDRHFQPDLVDNFFRQLNDILTIREQYSGKAATAPVERLSPRPTHKAQSLFGPRETTPA